MKKVLARYFDGASIVEVLIVGLMMAVPVWMIIVKL